MLKKVALAIASRISVDKDGCFAPSALDYQLVERGVEPAVQVADGWVAASKVYPGRFETYKAFMVFLNKHPEIRRWKPSKQRLEIHAADWVDYWAKVDSAAFDAMEHVDISSDEEAADAFAEEATRRLAKIEKKKTGK